ncbi:putative PEP-binding protein [Palleronia caenipelagi]|uniref:Pyruvate, phosphate dikinase n=1 Tax=Palleronia caenipelagi TaxID=2489174 RepID=A0A547PMX4_9RHOB|nr:putative PEP-binding protein [Palleronia caenipelagi]TRD15501.1 pyruvate, phosphate dikinase [Palleronia caenipelagi]
MITPGVLPVTPTSNIRISSHGVRAKCLQRLVRLGLPVPDTLAIDMHTILGISEGQPIDTDAVIAHFGEDALVSVRPSSGAPEWGGPTSILNIGMTSARHAKLSHELGPKAADALYTRFLQSYAVQVARLDPDLFGPDRTIDEMRAAYDDAMGEPFPEDPAVQLAAVLSSMSLAWNGVTARLLRQARGAPEDAGLALVVQRMVLGVGNPHRGESGSGVIQFVSSETGVPQITGRYMRQSQGREALIPDADALYLISDPRGPSMEEENPDILDQLKHYGQLCRTRLREEMQIEFTVSHGELHTLDALRVVRTSRAALRIAVDLATDGVIPEAEAVLRVPPKALLDVLHRQVDPQARGEVVVTGIPASPGAATGRIVFSARAAQSAKAREESVILIRRETTSGDVLGMHASAAILTERGGVTSHAAVIARGLGLPCVVGAAGVTIDSRARRIRLPDGRELGEGDEITVDGSTGRVFAGAVPLVQPEPDASFRTILAWADERRDIGVRANCDTPAEAAVAAGFEAEGIGLCRTEHMFFDKARLTVMREMIFADDPADRAAALKQLLPVQRSDFLEIFRIMAGKPVTIRLLDPPLHEFLPHDRQGKLDLAASLDLPMARVEARIEALSEVNPMLGLRGVRLGILVPEIYEMQARAIFEAAIGSAPRVTPEVMIPLVSSRREVEIVKARIEAVAAQVRTESGIEFDYRLGVMVETPRAALRADEIAEYASFLSFGTNDLTQMTYGLSRDDAGRFMSAYVAEGVFPEDPFLQLDVDGVGELLTMGANRARAARRDVTLSICGEHGGDPDSIAFCRHAGFDYVSCSPFRVPVARMAAAHLAIRARGETTTAPPRR